MKDLVLKSKMFSDRCEGQLFARAGNQFLIDILELPYLDNAHNISCIPAGKYNFIHHDGVILKDCWECVNPPGGRSGICIHSANFTRQLDGCLASGDTFGYLQNEFGVSEYGIYHSKIALDFLKRYIGRDQKGKLLPMSIEIVRM